MYTKQSLGRAEAVEHLKNALEAEDLAEKNFHLKQALQLLTIKPTDV